MKIIEQLLNLIFPPRPTEALVQRAKRDSKALPKHEGRFENIRFLTRYDGELVAASIRENKFFNNQVASKLISDVLTNALTQYKGNVVVIPIPLSKERLRERGHNQVETIARNINVAVKVDILERTLHTAPQASLDRAARLKNVANVYVCKKPDELRSFENTTIILLDDVVTTGATLKAARATLAPYIHPTSTLICMAIAH